MLRQRLASLLPRLAAVTATVTLLSCILKTSISGYVPFEFKSWHPILMTLGFCLAVPTGLVAYVANYGDKANQKFPDRAARRLLHGAIQLLGVIFIVTGYLVEFVHHLPTPAAHIAAEDGDSIAVRLHVWFGLAAVAGMILQVVVGLYKHVVITRDTVKAATWHGKVGPIVWALGLVVISLAGYFKFYDNGYTGAAVAIWLSLAFLLVTTLVELFRGPYKGYAAVASVAVAEREGRAGPLGSVNAGGGGGWDRTWDVSMDSGGRRGEFLLASGGGSRQR